MTARKKHFLSSAASPGPTFPIRGTGGPKSFFVCLWSERNANRDSFALFFASLSGNRAGVGLSLFSSHLSARVFERCFECYPVDPSVDTRIPLPDTSLPFVEECESCAVAWSPSSWSSTFCGKSVRSYHFEERTEATEVNVFRNRNSGPFWGLMRYFYDTLLTPIWWYSKF